MFSPWHMPFAQPMQVMPMQAMPMQAHPMMMRPVRKQAPLRMVAAGAFPVPEAIQPSQFPPAVRESIGRILEGPPKPSVTPAVMNATQKSMIAPDLPNKADV